MTDELKPCPFCGTVPVLRVRAVGAAEIRIYVRCGDCDIQKSVSRPPDIAFERLIEAKEKVVEDWNRREK